MKLSTQLIAASALLAAMGTAQAASADLEVSGTVKVAGCAVELTDAGIIDHGNISRGTLTAANNHLPAYATELAVTCGGDVRIAVKMDDGKKGTGANAVTSFKYLDGYVNSPANSTTYFGLGLTSTSAPIGGYQVKPTALPIVTNEAGAAVFANFGKGGNTSGFDPYNTLGIDTVMTGDKPYFTAVGVNGAVAGQKFRFPLEVATTLVKGTTLPEGDIAFEGIATMELITL